MRELKKLDKVAYIRFASVYRSFEDIDEFRALVDEVRQYEFRTQNGVIPCQADCPCMGPAARLLRGVAERRKLTLEWRCPCNSDSRLIQTDARWPAALMFTARVSKLAAWISP
jgi:hypothetical protein